MNIKELSVKFFGKAHDASMNIMDIIAQENNWYLDMDSSYNKKGISIDFIFRGETDYSLIFPWEYLEDDNKIRDYYLRFKSKCTLCKSITDIERIANTFIDEELQIINN
jgi:hypothetical protein